MQCRRSYPADTSLEDLAPRRQRLIAALLKERPIVDPVELRKPFFRIGDERLQQDSLRHPPHTDLVALKAKLTRQPDSLTPSVAKQLGNSSLGHRYPSSESIYH